MGEISTVDFFPFAWIIHLARALVFYNIVTAMTKRKLSSFWHFMVIVAPSMVYSYITLQLNDKGQKVEYLCLILYFVLQFIIVNFATEGKLFSKITAIVFSFLTMTMSSIIYFSTLNYIFGYDYTKAYSNSLDLFTLIAVSLFTVILSFAVVILIKLVQKKFHKDLNHNIKYVYLYAFPLTHFFGFQLIHVVQQLFVKTLNYFPKRITVLFCIYAAICFAIDFSIIFVVDNMEQKERENEKYKKLITKNELDYQQFLQLKNEKEKFKKIRHDMANILSTVAGFIEIGKSEKALEMIKSANNDIQISANTEICKNETINTIYAIKLKDAVEKKANLKVQVNESAPIKVSDYDLCRVLTNIIDNAINAVENNNISKDIELNIISNSNDILIKSKNAFALNKSKKKDTQNHGYGQKIIYDIAKKYNGTYTVQTESEYYSTVTQLNNIDLNEQ